MEFEDFVPLFGEWYSKGKSTAWLVGIRADNLTREVNYQASLFDSFEDLNNSLHQKIAKMPWDTTVMTGHGEQTTLREEMFSNPYLR